MIRHKPINETMRRITNRHPHKRSVEKIRIIIHTAFECDLAELSHDIHVIIRGVGIGLEIEEFFEERELEFPGVRGDEEIPARGGRVAFIFVVRADEALGRADDSEKVVQEVLAAGWRAAD